MSVKPRYTKWIAGFDSHGDQQDDPTIKAFLEFTKDFKPKVKIHGGDAFDLRWLRGRASEGEQREKVMDDINAGLSFLEDFKPDVFLTGNHDHRLWKAAECDDGKLYDFATLLIRDIKKSLGNALLLPWCKRHGVYSIGRQRFIHGFHAGVNAARQAALCYGQVCQGHVHAFDTATIPGIEKRVGRTSGALCKIDLGYNAGQPGTLRQENGWLYGLSYPNGDCQVWEARKICGAYVLPSEMREIHSP